MTIENEEVAVSGPSRAIDSVPSRCLSPVTLVRSSGIGGKRSRRRSWFIWNWMTWISTSRRTVLSGRTARITLPPSKNPPSTYFRKLPAVIGA
jgi:hypothetical protein